MALPDLLPGVPGPARTRPDRARPPLEALAALWRAAPGRDARAARARAAGGHRRRRRLGRRRRAHRRRPPGRLEALRAGLAAEGDGAVETAVIAPGPGGPVFAALMRNALARQIAARAGSSLARTGSPPSCRRSARRRRGCSRAGDAPGSCRPARSRPGISTDWRRARSPPSRPCPRRCPILGPTRNATRTRPGARRSAHTRARGAPWDAPWDAPCGRGIPRGRRDPPAPPGRLRHRPAGRARGRRRAHPDRHRQRARRPRPRGADRHPRAARGAAVLSARLRGDAHQPAPAAGGAQPPAPPARRACARGCTRRLKTPSPPFDRLLWLSKHGAFWRRLERHLAAHAPDVAIAFLPPAITALGLRRSLARAPAGRLAAQRARGGPGEPGALGPEPARPAPADGGARALRRDHRAPAGVRRLVPRRAARAGGGGAEPGAAAAGAPRSPRRGARRWCSRSAGWPRSSATTLLIDAFARLAAAFPDWSLAASSATAPPGASSPPASRPSGSAGRVRLMGQTDAIEAEYLAAAILCHPAEHEGWGLAVTEAMAAGLPPVGFRDCPGVNALIAHGVTGLLVEPGPDRASRVAALAAALAALMRDPARRAALGRRRARGGARLRPRGGHRPLGGAAPSAGGRDGPADRAYRHPQDRDHLAAAAPGEEPRRRSRRAASGTPTTA